MIQLLSDQNPLVQEIVNASGNKTPILVEGEPNAGEEIEFRRWCGTLPVRFFGRDGKEFLLKDLQFMTERIPPVFALTDRDLASNEEIDKTLTPDYEGNRFFLPRYDFECYYLEPEAAWHALCNAHFSDILNLDDAWKESGGILSQIRKIAEKAIPQTAANLVLKDPIFKGHEYFKKINPFLSDDQVLHLLMDISGGAGVNIETLYSNKLEYVKSFFPDKFFAVISGKHFLLPGFVSTLPEGFKLGQKQFRESASYYLNAHPPQDFIELVQTIIGRRG